jgi:hypothetical protein
VVRLGEATTLGPVEGFKEMAGVQVQVAAPEAVSVAVWPAHMALPVAVTVGVGFTVTVVVTGVAEQVPTVPFTVYTVVLAGEAVTMALVGLLIPVVGFQL